MKNKREGSKIVLNIYDIISTSVLIISLTILLIFITIEVPELLENSHFSLMIVLGSSFLILFMIGGILMLQDSTKRIWKDKIKLKKEGEE